MRNKIVIVDIDGTISEVGDRIRFLQQEPKDWDSFYEACHEDQPIFPIIDLVDFLFDNYQIVFCTGRMESVLEKTLDWMSKHFINPLFHTESRILMRKDGDLRHDTEVKPELLKEANINCNDVAFILEDRNSMVQRWRELGFKCLQVNDGNF